jgi:hypothetical protein
MAHLAALESLVTPYRPPGLQESPSRGNYEDPVIVELRAFVGPSSDYYLRKWAPRLEDPHLGEAGFHLPSLLVPVAWLGYRRMYKAAVLLIAVINLAQLAQRVLFLEVLGLDSMPGGVSLIVLATIHVVCALYANTWYLNHAERALIHAREQRLEGPTLLAELGRRGGTSVVGLLGVLMLYLLASLATGGACQTLDYL